MIAWRSVAVAILAVSALATHSATAKPARAKAAAPSPDEYAGAEVCIRCHGEMARLWEKQRHSQYLMAPSRKVAGKGCEECHGPGKAHAQGDRKAIIRVGKLMAERQAALCLSCHEGYVKNAEWFSTAHARQRIVCTDCHAVHRDPKGPSMLKTDVTDTCLQCHARIRPLLLQNSHHPVLEGRVECTSCHDVHRSAEPAMLRGTTKTLCLTCHRDKEGPFVYEHDPMVSEMSDNCLSCHTPHGSGNVQLLRLGQRGLCMQCHSDKVNHFPGPRCWTAGCHTHPHGSNSSPLLFF